MTKEDYQEGTFDLECNGRNGLGEEVLKSPLSISVSIHKKEGSNALSSVVHCRYNSGFHGEKCGLSDAVCPYSFDIPHAIDKMYNKE
tara:strand:- start:904 stop:1164 length:261 start_codon:yes stop_codon:yes gene_type:complete